MKRTLAILIGILFIGPSLRADFSDPVLKAVGDLQSQIILQSQRNINGADAEAMWTLFDQDVLQSLNGGVTPLTAEQLNKRYSWTDIQILAGPERDNEVIKTGGIEIKFFPLTGKNKEKPDWLTVYYHGLGVVPSSTFHIFQYQNDRYQRAGAMEETAFLNQHPKLVWHAIQLQLEQKKGTFSTYYVPVTSGSRINRSQVQWEWDGKKLKACRWIPEVDFHRRADGTIVPGRGPATDLP